jgi:hypothetical protein
MKWLSVKKYKPYFSAREILVRIENEDSHSYLELGYFCDGKWQNNEKNNLERNGKVTHFCIPDPIEIEDE